MVKPKKQHISGYQAGYSPETDRLPIVDNSLKVLGIGERGEVHKEGMLHPTVHLLMFSPDKRYILVQCRGQKDFSSGKLAQSVAGHAGAKEEMLGQTIADKDIRRTLDKETKEEAGLDPLTYSFVQCYPYESHWADGRFMNLEMTFLYTAAYSGRVYPNYSEVKWMGWFALRGIQKLIDNRPEMFSPSFLRDLEIIKNSQNK
ncbi:MAG: NUDIX domain-containing protein [Candidatus Margulisiibacteriota bacterium]